MTTVLLAGDSLALGLTAPLTALAKKYGIHLIGDGRTSTTARQWVGGGWLAKDIETNAPNITLISLGTNDATGDLGGFAQDVATLIDQATAKGGSVAWIGPPYLATTLKQFPHQNVDKMRQILLDTLTPRGINIFPTDADAPAKDYSRSADGIHMTTAGYEKWAHDIADFAQFQAAVRGQAMAPKQEGWSTGKKVAVGALGLALLGGIIYAAQEHD